MGGGAQLEGRLFAIAWSLRETPCKEWAATALQVRRRTDAATATDAASLSLSVSL